MFIQHKTMEVEEDCSKYSILNLSQGMLNRPDLTLPVTPSYEPAESIASVSSSFLDPPPMQSTYNMPSNDVQNMPPQGEWRSKEMSPLDQYFGINYSGSQSMMHDQMQRGMGPRSRNVYKVPCRHFIAGGCRYGMKCAFLHPGVNVEPIPTPSSSLFYPPPTQNMYGISSNDQNIVLEGDWRSKELPQLNHFSGGNYSADRNMMHNQVQKGMGPYQGNSHKVPCRYFVAGGCRYGMKCSFLHPGVNGPQM